MYNRYIPQSDGSYRRNVTPEAPRNPPPMPERPYAPPPQPPAPPPPAQPGPPPAFGQRQKSPMDISGFFKSLLPRGFDTGDLLVVLLILLMAGDCQEDQNTALLTLALYFFL
ncbi:MAG: hypothetical protein IJN53_06305 [Oscillospiraceae bacterium]|nr:hypothetical protein [Oscillospiraceae bacterium]